MVRHRDSVHAPSPRIAAADGFGAVHAPNRAVAVEALRRGRLDSYELVARERGNGTTSG
jgi:hypothetical protein